MTLGRLPRCADGWRRWRDTIIGIGEHQQWTSDLGRVAWLDACSDPEIQRIVLIDAPALGWTRGPDHDQARQEAGAVMDRLIQALAAS